LSDIFLLPVPFGVRAKKKEKYLEELTLVFSFGKKMLEQYTGRHVRAAN